MAKISKKKLTRDELRQQRGRTAPALLIKRVGKKKVQSLPVADPATASPHVLDGLAVRIHGGAEASTTASHSARLLSQGTSQVAQKLGEEAIECVIALMTGDKVEIVGESADVLYHLLVAWKAAGVRPEEVWAELKRREELSELIEGAQNISKETLRQAVGTSKIPV